MPGGLLARVQARNQSNDESSAVAAASGEGRETSAASSDSQKAQAGPVALGEGGESSCASSAHKAQASPVAPSQSPEQGAAANMTNMKMIAALAKIRLAGKEAASALPKKKGGVKALAPLGGWLARVH